MAAARLSNIRVIEKPQNKAWRPYYWIITAISLYIVFETYGPALQGPFVYDDYGLPFYDRSLPNNVIAWISGVRPLLMLSYWFNFELSGRTTLSYHIVNLLLHLANSVAVCLIAHHFLACEALDRARREIVAVFAGMLFLLHPIQTESVAWIAGRSEVLSAVFFLFALLIFVYRTADPIGWRQSLVILALFICAAITKEHTATLPVVLLFTTLFWARGDRPNLIRRNWRLYLLMLLAVVVAGVFIWTRVKSATSAGFATPGVSWSSYALTQCRVIFVYLRLFLCPVGQSIDYDMPWSPSHFTLGTFVGFVGIVTLAAAAWRLRRRYPVGSYGFLLFLILLAPTSSFIPIKDPLAEHRLYLPMVGLVLVASELLLHTSEDRTLTVAVAGVLITAVSIVTYQRNHVWGSEVALWEDTVAKSSGQTRGYAHLIHGYVSEHRCREALQHLDEWSQRMTIDATLLVHWAFAYECVHEPERALAKLEQSASQSPAALTYLSIARNQLALGRNLNAIQSLNRALKLNPRLEPASTMRANLFERLGYPSTAVPDFRHATKPFGTIDVPDHGDTISGSTYVTFGWTLCPPPHSIPVDGSTITVYIDEAVAGHPVYNQLRPDIATLYSEYANSKGAGGYFIIDTTKLTNGSHTVAWRVTDSVGRTDTIGRRIFFVQN